jgi:peptide/nickel transport system permease protein
MAEQKTTYHSKPDLNWALPAGGLLVLLVLVIGLFGPVLAPKDPMENAYIGQSGGRYVRPPFQPGQVEGFPLGSDEFGRDVLSKVLWAVRPTMNLVLVVAALRLSIGMLVGVISGWSTGRTSRILDSLISGALSVPVLFVALCIVAALAMRWGMGAFILGLSITGWAETARLAHDRTRAIKAQPFVEASEAMGAVSGQVVFSHVIPHILPLMWIQLAFEIGATLVSVAALGFLGYFINAVWVPGESDFVGIRASGTPELGQMLGVAVRNQPWTAMVAGTCVFVIVLAFNLLAEGLRQVFSERRKPATSKIVVKAGSWFEERLYLAMTEWQRLGTTVGAFGALALVVLGGGWLLWQSQNSTIAVSAIEVPGRHIWAAQLHDAQGTYWSRHSGPAQEDIGWQIFHEGGFMGGPVIDASGYLYLTGAASNLASFNSDGTLRWKAELPAEPVGWPALAPDGSVIVAVRDGSLLAYSPEGVMRWQYLSNPPDDGLSSPVVGPGGVIYYAVKNFLVAVTAEGVRDWQIRLPSYSYTSPLPRLSADGKYLFFEDVVVDAITGLTLFNESSAPLDKFMVGADGKVYFRGAGTVEEWQVTETGAVRIPQANLDQNVIAAGYRYAFDGGVSPSGHIWLLYSSGFEYMRMVWSDPRGDIPQIVDFPYRTGLVAGIDAQGIAYVCGFAASKPLECRAVRLNTGMILWKQEFPFNGFPVGGALADGRMYVSSSRGDLLMIGK